MCWSSESPASGAEVGEAARGCASACVSLDNLCAACEAEVSALAEERAAAVVEHRMEVGL